MYSIAPVSYKLVSSVMLIADAPSKPPYNLSFHLKNDDYFGLVATALNAVIEEGAQNYPHLLKKIRNDMRKLHKTHKIIKKQ